MPTPRKPHQMRVVQGTANDHPGRQNTNQPVPERGIGEAPSHMSEAERVVWDEINDQIYAGVAASGDRLSLEIICRLVAEMRSDFTEFSAARMAQLNSLLSKFGMTPSDRTKVVVPDNKNKGNPFDGF